MGVPQVIMIVLFSLGCFMALVNHGKSKGEYNFWATLIATAIEVIILKAGGFF